MEGIYLQACMTKFLLLLCYIIKVCLFRKKGIGGGRAGQD